MKLAILGDSIGYGVGAGRSVDTLSALLAADLQTTGTPVETRVLAEPGARSADLAPQVRRAVEWRPDVVLVVVGANDLTRLVPADAAAESLRAAIRTLRAAGIEVVVAPAPDMSVVPHVPPVFRSVVQAGSAALRERQIEVTLAEGGHVADAAGTSAAAFARDRRLFAADGFHPSSAGYAVIAAAIAPTVRAAAGVLGAAS
jgi:lysophospholipase L1-like esterase